MKKGSVALAILVVAIHPRLEVDGLRESIRSGSRKCDA